MATSKVASSQDQEPSSTRFWRRGVGALAALADEALSSGDRALAEDFVRAIFAMCDLAAGISRSAGATALGASKRARVNAIAKPRGHGGARGGSGSAGRLKDKTVTFDVRAAELVA